MVEQEYIRIESTIRKVRFGTERTDRLIDASGNLSETFKDDLWGDYSIDIDTLPKTQNREILEKLKHK